MLCWMRVGQNLRKKSFFRKNEPAPPIAYVLIRNKILVPTVIEDLNPGPLRNKGNREANRETVITLSTVVFNSQNFLPWTMTAQEHDKSSSTWHSWIQLNESFPTVCDSKIFVFSEYGDVPSQRIFTYTVLSGTTYLVCPSRPIVLSILYS